MIPITIDEISIEPSIVAPRTKILIIRCGDFHYRGQFDNHLGHFAQAVSEALKYFAVANGVATVDKDGTVRAIR